MNILVSPPVVFAFFILIGLGIYGLGALLAPPANPTPGKLSSYAGGEDIDHQQVPFSYQDFFRTALFYTVMEVAALVIATIPSGQNALWAFFYLFAVAIGIATLTFKYD
ncbi:MAG TPA: hypothetical protein PKL83_02460 [bacterium]|nr:hypothetical protein [bacterium]